MGEHTPWTVSNGVQIDGADGQAIAYLPADRKSCARLIAAAPDLLAALKAVVADIREYERVFNLSPNPGKKDCWQSVTAADVAIAKAEAAQRDMAECGR